MVVETEHVECLMGWLAYGSPARSLVGAERLVEKLAVVVFQGDYDWPTSTSRADDYRDALREWFADDVRESEFVDMADPDTDPGLLIDWFLPVVLEWEEQVARGQREDADGEAPRGWRNPRFDGTPGTEYYRIDAATGEYVYAEREDDEDWVVYDRRRYAEPAWDDAYGLTYRYDRKDGVYEWRDEQTATWEDQAWADAHAAGPDGSAGTSERSEVAWDENRRMFYRLGPNGIYEYADARIPGDESSGCGEVWLSDEQARTRVMPIHLIPGWQDLEGEPWAEGWYTLPDGSGGYTYLHSPDRTPEAGDDGWSQVPPAPPAPLTAEQEEEYAALGYTLDEAAEVIDNLTEALNGLAAPQE
ncbi:hypothetical protein AB0M11_40075 [Streptomyces sp. NPDC051987]|uniref:hypothetical protein n=1 Tax=Streptomyces sp. NPDC051987 TaxID=3155808 RepID=UPI0034271AE2